MAPRAAAGEVMPFNDDILEEILIRLRTLEDLGRACASCPVFRRIITSHSFLRRLHALRPPSLLGFHSYGGLFHPAEPPHPSAPAARAVAEAADFEFPFLCTRERDSWTVRDGRDGRIVLQCLEGKDPTLMAIAVCDPLFRRYKLLPPLPEDLAATGRQLLQANGEHRCRHNVFLAPCSEEEAEGMPGAFSVIWMAQSPTKFIAFIFSSASGQWQEIPSRSWHGLNPTMPPVVESPFLLCRSYAYGCFYWCLSGSHFCTKLIVLDIGRMEFYLVNYPSSHTFEYVAIVELGENRCGMFVLGNANNSFVHEDFTVRLFSANNQIHGEGDTEWVLENTVSLSGSSNFIMQGVADGKLLLQGAHEHNSEEEFGCILLDFKTGLVQRLRGIIPYGFSPNIAQYNGYPPSLSLPTI